MYELIQLIDQPQYDYRLLLAEDIYNDATGAEPVKDAPETAPIDYAAMARNMVPIRFDLDEPDEDLLEESVSSIRQNLALLSEAQGGECTFERFFLDCCLLS